MFESLKELTPAGKIKRLSYKTVVDWVNRLWNVIDISLIQKFFKYYNISNKCDRTEDNQIFNYDRLNQAKTHNEIEILNDDENDKGNNINNNHYNREERNYDNK